MEEEEEDLHETVVFTITYIMYALTIASLLYGVISWCVLKKFRNYRNYVCLNAILANLLYVTFYQNSDDFLWYIAGKSHRDTFMLWSLAFTVATDYLSAVKHHWLVVLCHMFYVDIVKVFNVHIQRRYLISFLFGWAASLILIGVHVSVGFVIFKYDLNIHIDKWPAGFVILMLPLFLNILLYLVIVYSLFRSSNASASTATSKWRRLYIATLIFILGDVALLSTYIVVFLKQGKTLFLLIFTKRRIRKEIIFQLVKKWSPNYTLKRLVGEGVMYTYLEILNLFINPIVLAIFSVIVRSNREMWYKFCVNKLNQRSSAKHLDINMHERVFREPADSRPASAQLGIQLCNHNQGFEEN